MGGLDQAPVDVRQAEELEQDDQRQAERQIADHGAEECVQHLHRAEAEKAEDRVQDAVVGDHRLPGIDPHDVAGEEGRDQQEDPEAPRRGRNLEGKRVGRGKCQDAAHHGRENGIAEGAQIGVHDIALAPHVDPVDGVEIGLEPEVLHRPEGHHDEEGERGEKEHPLPERERQTPEECVTVGPRRVAAGGGRYAFSLGNSHELGRVRAPGNWGAANARPPA